MFTVKKFLICKTNYTTPLLLKNGLKLRSSVVSEYFWRYGKAVKQYYCIFYSSRFRSSTHRNILVLLLQMVNRLRAFNPLDYSFWSEFENMTCQIPHTNLESFKQFLVGSATSISIETVLLRACVVISNKVVNISKSILCTIK